MANAQNTYTINGRVGSYNAPAKVYLLYQVNNEFVMDSCNIKNGQFVFSGSTKYPFFARITLDHDGKSLGIPQADVLELYVDPGTIDIQSKDSVAKAMVSGSPTTDLFFEYLRSEAVLRKEGDLLQNAFNNSTPEQRSSPQFRDSLDQWYQDIQRRYNNMSLSFIESHPESILGVYMLQSEINMRPGNDNVGVVFERLSDKVKNTEPGQMLAASIEKVRTLRAGESIPDFEVNDIENKPVKFSDFRGKYILVSFWSPECSHCKQEMPALKEAYRSYKDKGFTILSVAVESEQGRQNWLDEVKNNAMDWTNVSDLKGWAGDIVGQCRVFVVPYNYLVDPDGKIIAKELYGDILMKKLDEVLPK